MAKSLLTWDDDGTANLVYCDAIVSFNDERSATITRHPIENGSSVSDHRIINPDKLIVEVHHSRSPVEAEEGFQLKPIDLPVYKSAFKPQGLFLIHSAVGNLVGAALGLGNKPPKSYILQATTDKDRIVELHDALLAAFLKGAKISIEQYGRRYEDYVLSFVGYRREGNGIGGRGIFHLELETIRTVKTATTELPDPSRLHAKPKTDRGVKPGKDASKDIAKGQFDQDSIAYRLAFGKGGAAEAFGGAIQ